MMIPMRHIGTFKNLVFSLPCLSKTEQNYINQQIIIKNNRDLNFSKKDNLKLKYEAAASAYNISDNKTSYDNMVALFNSGCYQKRKGRVYSVHNPHLSTYLNLGTILCDDISDWLQQLSENRFNVKTTVSKLVKSDINIEDKFKSRLMEVVEDLDLDLEQVIDESVMFDENGFSSSFYHNFMFECCGVTQEQS